MTERSDLTLRDWPYTGPTDRCPACQGPLPDWEPEIVAGARVDGTTCDGCRTVWIDVKPLGSPHGTGPLCRG
jgi:hypothetical protein